MSIVVLYFVSSDPERFLSSDMTVIKRTGLPLMVALCTVLSDQGYGSVIYLFVPFSGHSVIVTNGARYQT